MSVSRFTLLKSMVLFLLCRSPSSRTPVFPQAGIIKAVFSTFVVSMIILYLDHFSYREGNNVRALPNQIENDANTTIDGCLNLCALYGYPAAGLEFGNQCFCGDFSDVETNSQGIAPETDCNIPCSGDLIHLCGGPLRLTVCFFPSSSQFHQSDMFCSSTTHSTTL